MKTYIKIFGPPLLEAYDALQKIAVEMPEVKHYHTLAAFDSVPEYPFSEGYSSGGSSSTPISPDYPAMVSHPMVSKSGHTLGEYDFFFEWVEEPTWSQMRDLMAKIDKALTPLGCKYTLTSK